MVESMPQIDICYIPDDKHITLTPPSPTCWQLCAIRDCHSDEAWRKWDDFTAMEIECQPPRKQGRSKAFLGGVMVVN